MDVSEEPKGKTRGAQTPQDFVSFLKELAKYYMSFLETDFHKRRRPRRYIRYHDEKNPDFKVGLNLSKYPEFNARTWRIIANRFQDESVSVPKGKYRMEMPSRLHDLLKLQVDKLVSEETMSPAINSISDKLVDATASYPEEYDTALETCLEQARLIIKKEVVVPLVNQVEKPIQNMNLGDENTIFLIEEELTDAIVSLLEEKMAETVKLRLVKEDVDLPDGLESCFQIDDIRNAISSFFEGLQFTDLYAEIFEIDRCKNIQENKEFYLYFCDIAHEGVTYPVFYIPLTVQAAGQKYIICFDSQIFVNKKALDFVTQEYNRENNKTGTLKSIRDRIIYIYESQDTLLQRLSAILDEICNLFGLDGTISLYDHARKVLSSMSLQVSNSCYLVLFDKADEALINDYEELLNLPPDSELVESLSQIAQEFINEDPENYNDSVEEEWERTETSDKLVAQCPIPLNSEQRCILSALKKAGTRIITVEGPPGTGKSHTITAVVFGAILENQSVLVLSDKKEALDVVEDKITSTVNSVRHDEHFQNPILRLGKAKNTYSDILSPAAIAQIKTHHQVIRSNYDSLKQGISKLSESLKESIHEEIQAYCEINIDDIGELCELDKQLPTDDSQIIISEALRVEDSAVELQEFRTTFKTLNDNVAFDDNFRFSALAEISQDYLDRLSHLIDTLGLLERIRIPDISADQGLSLLRSIRKVAGEEFHRDIDIQVITDFLSLYHNTLEGLKTKKVWKAFECDGRPVDRLADVEELLRAFVSLGPIVEKVKSVFSDSRRVIGDLTIPHEFHLKQFEEHIDEYDQLRGRFLGFLFKGKRARALDLKFKKAFPYLPFRKPHRCLKQLKRAVEVLQYAVELKDDFSDMGTGTGSYLHYVVAGVQLDTQDEMKEVSDFFEAYQIGFSKIGQHEWLRQLEIDTFGSLFRIQVFAQFLCTCDRVKQAEVEGIEHILPIEADLYERLLTADLGEIRDKLARHKSVIDQIAAYSSDIQYLREHLPKYPKTLAAARIDINSFPTLCRNRIAEMSEDTFELLARYISLWQQIEAGFRSLPSINYANNMKLMEQLVAAEMTYILDGRVLKFHNKSKATAKTLREIIRAKRRFPKNEFAKLKEAFPCILASVRDYAEYIPLLPEIFDVVIIDEASQVSIAQAFPALLRGKKVLVLGDNKQFSNIKAAQARADVNKEHMNNLEDTFRRCVSEDSTKLIRLAKFNIKTSILDFTGFINNYNVQLQKHFRCYKELISYSNSTFYEDSLQVMKIRGKRIDDVLKFTIVPHDGQREVVPKTNSIEADFIMAELKKLVAEGHRCSVGVITPHTNQQKLIYQQAHQLPEGNELFDRYRLKVMTFDTCQGEERDVIYFSMVATDQDDRLGYIFPKDLKNVDFDGDGRIRVQRLNVGFSRTKECMHFVLSRNLSQYTGAIGDALRHYQDVQVKAKNEVLPTEVDQSSPMEANVLNWFYQTRFWKDKQDSVEIIPQFPIGEYLQQLDRTYSHPKYKVDFLLIYYDGSYEHKIIIEYDGFKEHFTDLDAVNEFNYQYYYRDDDVYREKVLEGYGYRFLRINRFNLGENPIVTLDQRLQKLVERRQVDNTFLSRIHNMISQIENGEMKECPKCEKVLSRKKFYDSALATSYGRICVDCKGLPKASRTLKRERVQEAAPTSCPKCSSPMVVRNGRYGYFYGCKRYPYCRGTRNID